jgi:hypothetical protein
MIRASKRSVLLYDSDAKCAWLVSELSVVLHITHLFLKQAWQPPLLDSTMELPYASISSDGGDAAFHAITKNSQRKLWVREEDGPDGKPKRFMDVVEDFLKLFHTIRTSMVMRKEKAGRALPFRNVPLQGWEFLDLLEKDYFCDRELPKGRDRELKSCWWKLPECCDVLTILGSKFGQLIKADPKGNAICKRWSAIPTGLGLLVASVPCLVELGKDCQGIRNLAPDLEWGTPKAAELFACGKAQCSCIPIQKLREPPGSVMKPFSKELQFLEMNAPEGALIFGDINRYRDRFGESREKSSAHPQHQIMQAVPRNLLSSETALANAGRLEPQPVKVNETAAAVPISQDQRQSVPQVSGVSEASTTAEPLSQDQIQSENVEVNGHAINMEPLPQQQSHSESQSTGPQRHVPQAEPQMVSFPEPIPQDPKQPNHNLSKLTGPQPH